MSTIARRALLLSTLTFLAGCAADVGSESAALEDQALEVVFLPATATDARALQNAGFEIQVTPAGVGREALPRTAGTLAGPGDPRTDTSTETLHPGEAMGMSGIIAMRPVDGAVALPPGSLELLTPEGPLPILDETTAAWPEISGWRVAGLSRRGVERAGYPSFNGWRVAGCDPDPWALGGRTLAGVAPASFAIDGVRVDGVAVLMADGEPVGAVGRAALGDGSIGIMPYAELIVGVW